MRESGTQWKKGRKIQRLEKQEIRDKVKKRRKRGTVKDAIDKEKRGQKREMEKPEEKIVLQNKNKVLSPTSVLLILVN